MIGAVELHSGNQNAHRASTGSSRQSPGVKTIRGVGSKLYAHGGARWRDDGVHRYLDIGGCGHDTRCDDGHGGGGSFSRVAFACGADCGSGICRHHGRGVIARGVDGAHSGITAGDSVDEPVHSGGIAGDRGGEVCTLASADDRR
jgi:hypothetical protein